ncbi:PhoPQ-activated pathogenicity protein [Bremerella cremea]|uniref:PhoPQ-activated pathogenicity protein n=1 Tax=Bremerella cremea TaxID=1031537 RepID=A0A368KTW6_9BACT|nr:PhoPQ-activated protein PqaA family protein [Bremerella cremea]RCS53018.1 PhoPQ-activated pathogenicity protein [Bremerella cremea]
MTLSSSLTRLLVGCFCCVAVSLLANFAQAVEPTEALAAYVHQADDSYGWKVRSQTKIGTCSVSELILTSQTWRDLVWQHRMFVIVPEGVAKETDAVLVIGGGSWKEEYADDAADGETSLPKEATLLSVYAQQIGCPVAVLLNVPRQPIFDGKREDEIIALTFDKYLKTGESDWPLLLPMVKSAVRAMDAMQEFAAQKLDIKIDGFTVTGASKRGWTTWLVSAVDPRVKGLAPMVIDTLNMEAQLKHQIASYGKPSQQIEDYTELDLHRRLATEEGTNLRTIVDPYSYRDQITQPKLIFLGTNDAYWTVDSLNLYWDDLKGQKYVVYVPNAGHGLANDWLRIFGGLRALRRHVDDLQPLPNLDWKYTEASGDQPLKLDVNPNEKAAMVKLWTADAPTRDFRESKWTSQVVPRSEAGNALSEIARPESGYRAAFAEVTYSHDKVPFYLSTTIRVLGAKDTEMAGGGE